MAKVKKRYAFEASGRWTQIHYVEATSAKEARRLFGEGFGDDCLDFSPVRTGVKRVPEYDEPAEPSQ